MKKILIIDDDLDILEPLELLLTIQGFKVETTTKGELSIEKAIKFKPDLILLDILMTNSDGRIICQKLKKSTATKEIPVVMISAHPSAKQDAETCEADGFMAKPFESASLIKLINQCL